MSVTCSTSTCRRTRPTTCTASVAPPAPAPRAMPSASPARSTPCRSRRSRVMSATRFPSPRSPRSSSPPGWWPAPRIRTGRGTQAGALTVAGAVTGVVGAVTAAGRAGAGAGTLPARTVAEVVELSDETAVALGTPLALSFFLWRPPPAALRPSQAHLASHRGPSPPVLLAVLALIVAGVIALLVARALRTRAARAAGSPPPPVHWLDHSLRGAVILAPFLAAVAVLLGSHVALAALGGSTEVIDGAVRIVGALVLVRLAVFALGLMLGPESWVGTRESRITLILWAVAAVAMLGWLDALEAALNRISLLPGRTTLSVWGLLKGLVVVTAFVIVASLVAG